MPKHFPNINPTITIVGHDRINPLGQRLLYVINRMGDEIREPQPDGSVIIRRPVVDKTLVDFGAINEEALLTIVADRLADRAAGEYGNRKIESASRQLAKVLATIKSESTKPLRKRPLGEPVVVEDDEDEGASPEAAAIQIPGVVAAPAPATA